MEISTEDLLRDWYKRIRFVQFCHYEAAKVYDRMNYRLGVPVIILSTLAGSSMFSNIGNISIDTSMQIAIGLSSLVAASLASLQTFFRFSEKAEKHRISASKYGALRREVEEIMATQGHIDQKVVTHLRQKIDLLAEDALHLPNHIWARRQDVLKEDEQRAVGLGRKL